MRRGPRKELMSERDAKTMLKVMAVLLRDESDFTLDSCLATFSYCWENTPKIGEQENENGSTGSDASV